MYRNLTSSMYDDQPERGQVKNHNDLRCLLFLLFDSVMNNRYSERYREYIFVGVGAMKDSKLKLIDLCVSYTLLS